MHGYRLYFLDRFSGRIDRRRDFLADTDADAIEVAAEYQSTQPMELWQGARKLKRWEVEVTRPGGTITAHGA